jgi:sugar diacid utilization regulator
MIVEPNIEGSARARAATTPSLTDEPTSDDVVHVEETQRVIDAHRRLSATLAHGGGLEGLVETVDVLLGRHAALWNGRGALLASTLELNSLVHPDVVPIAGDPTRAAFFRSGDLLCCSTDMGAGQVATVGVVDPDGTCDPVGRLVVEQACLLAAVELSHMKDLAATELKLWGELAQELLYEPDRHRVRAHARAFQYEIDRPHRVVLIEEDDTDVDQLVERVRRALRHLCADGIVSVHGQRVVLLAAGDLEWTGLERSLNADTAASVRIATSSVRPAAEPLEGALQEAETAARLRRTIGGGAVVHFDGLGIYRLFAGNDDASELDAYVRHWLGPIIDYDAAHRSDLVGTLSEYLESGGSLERASNALFVHRSTLKYRLRRIAEVLGRDLADPDLRFNLQLAIRIFATIRAMRPIERPEPEVRLRAASLAWSGTPLEWPA